MWQDGPSIIFLSSLDFFIFTQLVDIHFWPMSVTHLSWISFLYFLFLFSLHQSHLLLVLIQTWAKLHVLDNLLHLLLGVVVSINQHDPNKYRLDFHFLLLVLCSDNGYIFQLFWAVCSKSSLFFHFSFLFILYSTTEFQQSFPVLSFISSLLLLRILSCCPLSSSSTIPFISFEEFYFPHSLDLQNLC